MYRRACMLVLLIFCSHRLLGQDLSDLQIHGYANQGFVISSNNNFLSMSTSKGSFQWTEGAISVTDPINDKLRVGIQLHMYQIGQLGGPDVEVDWALGDYKVNDWFGLRAGKIKIPMGLFNKVQDVDSLYPWALLPQGIYPIENREMNLAALGGEVYGNLSLGKHHGNLLYDAFLGEGYLAMNSGYGRQLQEYGLNFPTDPSGRNFGGDLRWMSPKGELTLGASAQSQALDGQDASGSLHMPPALMFAYYAQWTHGKLELDAEYWRTPLYPVLTVNGVTVPVPIDGRAWYPMVDYRLAKGLTVGTYYSHWVNKSEDTSQPANYSKDWVLSSRYDFNQYFYAKLEGHFLHGIAVGYDAQTNPNGLKDNASILAARIGFAF